MWVSVVDGPGGAVQASAATDQIRCIGHFYPASIFSHPALNLAESLLVLWYAEGRKDKDLISLEPVDVCPAIRREILDLEIQLIDSFEMGLQYVAESCRHLGVKLLVVGHDDGVIVHKADNTIGVAIYFTGVPRENDQVSAEVISKNLGQIVNGYTRILFEHLRGHDSFKASVNHVSTINADSTDAIAGKDAVCLAHLCGIANKMAVLLVITQVIGHVIVSIEVTQ